VKRLVRIATEARQCRGTDASPGPRHWKHHLAKCQRIVMATRRSRQRAVHRSRPAAAAHTWDWQYDTAFAQVVQQKAAW